MIRKLLACLGLIALCFVVLHLTIGFENFAVSNPEPEDPDQLAGDAPQGSGQLPIEDADGKVTAITITTKGPMRIPMRNERILLEGGRELIIPLYTLIAEDSEPVGDDLWRLEGVRVEFQEAGIDDNGQPVPVRTGELIASTAFVQIGRDQNGMPSVVKEDRDIDLRDVIFSTEPTARIKNLRLQVARILVHSSAAGTRLHTPTKDQTFELLMKGEQEMTMTGRGLDFYMPADRAGETDRYLEIRVNSYPRIDREDISLHAAGKMNYREDMGRGVARVILDDEVAIRSLGSDQQGELIAHGDHLDAILVRRGRDTGKGAVWQKLLLTGKNVTLDFGDMKLACRQLDVRPSLAGEPYLLTASGLGSPVSLKQTGDQPLSFSAARRIHLCRLEPYFDPIYRGFGIPSGHLGSWMQQLIIFEGKSEVRDQSSGLFLTAEDGIVMLRSKASAGPTMAVGLGAVDVVQADLTMTGASGFTLWQNFAGSRLRLGPANPDPGHYFSLTSGDGLTLTGHGMCEVQQGQDGTTHLHLISPTEDLEIQQAGAQLRAVGTLDIQIVDGEPSRMLATGEDCHLSRDSASIADRIEGHASRIESADGRNFSLSGSPARLQREFDGSDLRAPYIDIFQLADDQLMVIARANETSLARATLMRTASAAQPIDSKIRLDAELIRLLPRLEQADMVELESLGLESFLAEWDQPHLFAQGNVQVVQEDQSGVKLTDARGDAFIMQLSEQSGILGGTPAKIVREQPDGKRMVAMARQVHFRTNEGGETVMVLVPTPGHPPVVEITGFRGDEFGDFENLRITCQGEIHARQEKVEFLGPVLVQQLDAEGKVKPGMRLVAEHMDMLSNGKQLNQISVWGEAVLDFEMVTIKGDRLIIDVLENSCLGIGGNNDVEISYPGSFARGPMMKINYRTMDMESWFTNLDTDGKIQGR